MLNQFLTRHGSHRALSPLRRLHPPRLTIRTANHSRESTLREAVLRWILGLFRLMLRGGSTLRLPVGREILMASCRRTTLLREVCVNFRGRPMKDKT